MGACGSSDDRKKKLPNRGDNKDFKESEVIKGEIKNQDEIKEIKEEEPSKLRSVQPNINIRKSEYHYKLKDLSTEKLIEDHVSSDYTISELLKSKQLKSNGDFIIEFENNIKIGYEKRNEIIGNLIIEIFKNNIPEIIDMNYSYKGLDIPDNVKQAYIDSNEIIGSAILDNQELFTIITFERDIITPYSYKRKDNEELIKFNLFTAFCNANGCLYFSGGEDEQTYDPDKTITKYNDFFYVDLKKLNENKNKIIIKELPNMNESRTWHSMIYVPYKYIFIVGGSNTKSVEIYNMETKEIKKDSELNEFRSECTLCLVNNVYLYAFFGFLIHQEYNRTIERCNLLKEEREWEYVDYINTLEKSGINFKISFFGISYYKDDEIILIGSNDNGDEKHYDYKYKIGRNEEEKDEINEFDCNFNETNNVFRDKLFMPIDDNRSINIPLIIGEEIKIFIFNTNTGNISIKKYDEFAQ